MATHNFQIFDESYSDIMTDIDYQSDSQRTGGVIPGVADPLLHNKLYRQCSVMAYAIAQTIVARGYSADDSDPVALANAIQRTFAFSVNGNVPNASGAVTMTKPLDAWPVGSIFITTSATNPANLPGFNGSTWVQIQGKYLLAASSTYTLGNSYGSMTKSLSTSNIPGHTHGFTTGSAGSHSHTASTGSAGNHSHTEGSLRIQGSIVASDPSEVFTGAETLTQSGALRLTNKVTNRGALETHSGTGYMGIDFDSNRAGSWSGATSNTGAHTHSVTVNSNGAHTHSGTTNSTGNGTAFNVMPESIAVNVWQRTA